MGATEAPPLLPKPELGKPDISPCVAEPDEPSLDAAPPEPPGAPLLNGPGPPEPPPPPPPTAVTGLLPSPKTVLSPLSLPAGPPPAPIVTGIVEEAIGKHAIYTRPPAPPPPPSGPPDPPPPTTTKPTVLGAAALPLT